MIKLQLIIALNLVSLKKLVSTIILILLIPILDSCVNCNCDIQLINYDYNSIEFYLLSDNPVPSVENLEFEVSPEVVVIASRDDCNHFGLMACSCAENYEPVYDISSIEVISFPSFFDSGDSSAITSIVEIDYYVDEMLNTINLGEGTIPQFYDMGYPYFITRINDRPIASGIEYSILFRITKTNSEKAEGRLENLVWE